MVATTTTLDIAALKERVATFGKTHDMKTDPRIIYHFIKSQAGSLGKAMMELVQNSIDAGATKIEITLGQTEFTIEDDGQGFGTAEDIHRNFGTFGTPHEEGDSRYGRFRLGRGQIMAFASTRWETPRFIMEVDVQNKGLNYTLTRGPNRKGVKILGTFYAPVDGDDVYRQKLGAELDRTIREVSDLVKYSDITVVLNGQVINTDPRTVKWDLENEDAYYDFKSSGAVKLYNMGFYVRDYPSYTYGSAVVVTKTHLKLNMARNQVLESECPLWKRVTATLKSNMVKNAPNKRMNDETRGFLIRSLRFGEQAIKDVDDLRIITLVTGTNVSLSSITFGDTPIASAPKGSALGQRVHVAKLAYVFADETLARFGATNIDEFKETMRSIYAREYGENAWQGRMWNNVKTTTVTEAGALFLTTHEITKDTNLNPVERGALTVLRGGHNWNVARMVQDALGRTVKPRTIVAGESGTALAWTDGHSYIAFSRALLNTARYGTAAWLHILHTLVHEYVHDEYDGEHSYTHTGEFYLTLDNVLTWNVRDPKNSLYSLADGMATQYLQVMAKKAEKSMALKKKEAVAATFEAYEEFEATHAA
jgi:hypothetical protein